MPKSEVPPGITQKLACHPDLCPGLCMLLTRRRSRPIAPTEVNERLWLLPRDCSQATFHSPVRGRFKFGYAVLEEHYHEMEWPESGEKSKKAPISWRAGK